MELSDNDLSSATTSGRETPGVIFSNNQGSSQKHENPPRKYENEKRSDNSFQRPVTQHANITPRPLKTQNKTPEQLGARVPSNKADKSYAAPTMASKQPPPATDITKATELEGVRSHRTAQNIIGPSKAVGNYTNRPANQMGHNPAGTQAVAGTTNRSSTDSQSVDKARNMLSEHQSLQPGQLKVQSERGHLHRGGTEASLRVEDSNHQHHQRQQHSEETQGRLRQQNQQYQPPSRQLQSQVQGCKPQQRPQQQRQQIPMEHQNRLNQQEQSQRQQPLRQGQSYSQTPQKPQRSGQPGPATSERAGNFNSGGRSSHQVALPARNIPNSNISRRVE